MELKLKTEKASLKLTMKDDDFDFALVTKAYEIVTGKASKTAKRGISIQQLKAVINGSDTHKCEPQSTREDDDRIPGWKQPVKAQLMCPYCGHCQDTTTLYGDHWLKCPACGKKVRLQSATSRWGIPDEHGYYYKATEVYRDRDDEKVDDDLLNEMKQKMEGTDDED